MSKKVDWDRARDQDRMKRPTPERMATPRQMKFLVDLGYEGPLLSFWRAGVESID